MGLCPLRFHPALPAIHFCFESEMFVYDFCFEMLNKTDSLYLQLKKKNLGLAGSKDIAQTLTGGMSNPRKLEIKYDCLKI